MKVTVLVCTRNRPEIIETCILSVLNNSYRDFEFLIVDQSTDEKTEEIVREYMNADKRIKYLHLDGQGKSKSLNLGIRNSSGEIVAMTDDDCAVAKDWIENIIKAFEENPDADIVFGRVIHKEIFPIKDRKFSGRLSKLLFIGDGANRSTKQAVFKKIKGFDELLGPGAPLMGLEDQDFAYRILKCGLKILNAREVVVVHAPLEPRSKQEIFSNIRGREIGKGAMYFKHIRCFDLAAILIFLVGFIQRISNVSWAIMLNKQGKLTDRPRILLLIQAWLLITYWNLSGMIMSLRYPIDKANCLFIPRE